MKILEERKNLYRIERSGGMRTDAYFVANERIYEKIFSDDALKQLVNVAHLPSLAAPPAAMPDIHFGYGFPIGGVAAFDAEEGLISPGGVGYDINCGVRLILTDIEAGDAIPGMQKIINDIFKAVPCGVGSRGKIKAGQKEFEHLLRNGVKWALDNGYAEQSDPEKIEDGGCLETDIDTEYSKRSYERGFDEIGTLGAGNHFIELQKVCEIYDSVHAGEFGLKTGLLAFMIHSGSRGFGYQICEETIKELNRVSGKFGIDYPDRQLIAAPIKSPEGRKYLSLMNMAANYAYVNRQVIDHLTRRVIREYFPSAGISLFCDICHNIAKFENLDIKGEKRAVLIHRKGATRALGPGNELLKGIYSKTGQPVLIPGDFAAGSFVMLGTKEAEELTYSSSCHGAGRLYSRKEALRTGDLNKLLAELAGKNIAAVARSKRTLLEERPGMYKNIDDIADSVEGCGICTPLARLRPLGVVKG